MNVCTVAGCLGQDPEVRRSQNGTVFASLSIATSSWVKGESITHWHRISVVGKAAEHCERFKKGMRVGVTGELQYRKWENKDGVAMTTAEIVTFGFVEWLCGDKPQSKEPLPATESKPWANEKSHAATPGIDDVPF